MSSVISRLLGVGGPRSNNPLDDRYYPSVGGGMSSAGVPVSAESAQRVSTVNRCVSITANTLAMLPGGVYEDLGDGRERVKAHPMDTRFNFRPNTRQSSFEWRRQLYVHLLLRGNAYCQMVPVGRDAFDLIPLHPDRIKGPEETPSGLLRYEFTRNDGTRVKLLGGIDLWHLRGLSDDGLSGLATVDLARDSIGLAMAAEQHAATFYDRGVTFSGVLQHPQRLKAETAREMSESFSRAYGGQRGRHKTPVLWEGLEFKPLSMTHKDAEFLESRKFSVADICRWFGVPPHLAGDVERSTSWGTGIEEQNLAWLLYSLLPWITLFEQSARRELLLDPQRYYVSLNVNALLRANIKTRYEVYAIAITNGILSPNECRELEERNPRPGGDEYLTPLNMQRGSDPLRMPPDGEKAAITLAKRLALELDARPALPPGPDGRATALARRCASRVADRESEELLALWEKSSGSAEKWRRDVASFFGRHAAFVAEELSIAPEEAREYCHAQRDAALSKAWPDAAWKAASMDRLVPVANGEMR